MKPHTGERKRPIGAGQREAIAKKRYGSRAEREAAAQLYAPWTGQCAFCPSRYVTGAELEEHERECPHRA